MQRRSYIASSAILLLVLSGCGLKSMLQYRPRQKLFRAVQDQDERRVRELLDKGLDVNTETYLSQRALSIAAWQDDPSMVRVLLEYGATVDGNLGELDVRTAADYGSPESVRLMLEAGADPNTNYYLGGTILMGAVEAGNLKSAEHLLRFGADPNQRGNYDANVTVAACEGTPLTLAARDGNLQIVELLLVSGADPSYSDEFRCSARDAAGNKGHQNVVAILDVAIAARDAPFN